MDAFERSLTVAPTYVSTYESLASFHLLAGRPDAAAQAWRRLLNRTPDNLDALFYLGTYYLSEDEPLKALEFAERARGQKPLDRKVGNLLWAAHVGAARHYAREGKCEEARQKLAIADQLEPARQSDYDVLARKAILETKAGSTDAARQFVEQAQEHLLEPTALWLAMTIEAVRYDLPKEEAWLYEKRWQDALKRRCRSETAGLMCRMMHAHLLTQPPYPHRSEHVQQLLKYVRRCSRVKWRAEDLRTVCDFLNQENEEELLVKFAKKGIRKCPEVALFHMLAGTAEIGKGPMRCDLRLAMNHLHEAIRLGSASNDPRDEDVVRDAKRGVSLLEGCLSDFEDDDDDDDDDESDYYEDEPYDGDASGVSRDEIIDGIRDMCARVGLNPDVVMEDPVLKDLIDRHSKKS
jgi:tetratricopeptide (TPR) repeat protein